MTKHLHILYAILFLFACGVPVTAREKRLGTFFSPKGLGVSLQVDNGWGDEIRTFNLYADMYGVYSGRTRDAGIAFSYTHNYILKVYDFDYSRLSMYAGAGFLAGYLHDFENGMFSVTDRQLQKNMGVVAALSCNFGLGFDFDRRVTVDISFSLCPGLHMRRDPDSGSTIISAFRRGYISALYPQLCIYYRF